MKIYLYGLEFKKIKNNFMNLKKLQNNWDEFGKNDPLWSILTVKDKKGNKWEINKFFKTGEEEIAKVMKHVELLSDSINRRKALDFGCGVGRLTQALADYFEEVCGVDIAPSMIYRAKKYNRHGNRCKFYLNAKNNLNLFDSNSFDFIYSNIVLQHMKPKYTKEYIKEFIRVLNKNGFLIFQIPSKRIRINGFIRKLVRRLVPFAVLDRIFYLRIRLTSMFKKGPMMEVYSIKKEEVVKFIEENGAKILNIIPDQMNHGRWESYIYFVTKG
jgi:ubiquinone/menaquinone biosynthesis C-methylase UbiE